VKARVLYLLKFYLLTVLVFTTAKVVFMLCNAADHPFTLGDMFAVIFHGLSLDLSTALYFLTVPFLLTIVSLWLHIPRSVFRGYYLLIALAFSLAFVADTSLYAFWQFKLDAGCLQYLETPTEAFASVTTGYLVLRVVLWLIVAAGIFYLYDRLRLPSPFGARWVEVLLYLLLLPLFVIGIRGGLGESTTNIGQVYYSDNQFLNHSAVNPLFSFLYSLGKSGDYIVEYHYFDDNECERLTQGYYDTRSVDVDTLLNSQRPNIILIMMESCGGQFTEIGGRHDITPHLNQLAHEGIYFTQCYANSWRTDRGTVSILSGYPALPITSVMKIPEKSRKLPSIAASLQQEGYTNSFFYGGDINFTNMRSYVMSTGYKRLRWKSDYSLDEQQSAKWGVRDDIMFQSLLDDIKAEPAESRWMKTLLTLSSHEPWDVPTHVLDDEVLNAFHYLDQCVGQFISQLHQLPAWDNLLVIILPDHGYRYQGINETTRLFNHIPMIWTGGAVKAPREIPVICNQSDLPATLLGQLHLSHNDFTFSRDVLSSSYVHRMAFHTYTEGMTVFDSTGFMAYDIDVERFIAHEGPDRDRLLQQGKSLLQLISNDLVRK
jgi:phosphoglycerol transferase MdoB-like AlkP superfamily enzyme